VLSEIFDAAAPQTGEARPPSRGSLRWAKVGKSAEEMSPTATAEEKQNELKEYRKLLAASLPRVIQTEEENESTLALLRDLDKGAGELTPAEKRLADLLTLLIEDFEERHYQLKAASPIQALTELMRANNLRQKDLLDIFGTASILSEILSGKRKLTTEHIKKVSRRFHVSPDLFL
jgi:HTH-type transcriptional regulator / antitoxin HigA